MLQKQFEKDRTLIEQSEEILDTIESNNRELKDILRESLTEPEDVNEESVEELRENLEELKKYSTTLEINNREVYADLLRKDIDNLASTPILRVKIEKQIKMLEELFTFNRLLAYRPVRKFDKKVLKELKAQARRKLVSASKYTFTEPNQVEKTLKEVLEDRKLVDKIMWRLTNFILDKRMENEGSYIYFIILTLSSIDKEEMKDRELVINNLKELF